MVIKDTYEIAGQITGRRVDLYLAKMKPEGLHFSTI